MSDSLKPTCVIYNGRNSYSLSVDDAYITFTGSSAAEYFAKHYSSLGYEVKVLQSLDESDLLHPISVKTRKCLCEAS